MHAPIFVVGSSRSGSSLLRAILNAHSQVHLLQEASLYGWGARLPQLDGRQWFEAYTRTASFQLLQIPADEVRAQLPETLPRSELRQVFSALMQHKAARFGKQRGGDKTPLQIMKLPEIFADFPEARVVAMVRHPVPTVASLMRMPWGADSVTVAAGLVHRALAAVYEADPRVLVVKLEDLLAAPEDTLRRVAAHLDLPWEDRLLNHADHADFEEDPDLPWFRGAAQPLRPPSTDKQPDLTPAQVRWIERLCGQDLAHHGYARWDLPTEPGLLSTAAMLLPDLGRALRYGAHMVATAPELKRPERLDAREQLRWLFGLNPSPRVPAGHRALPALPPPENP